MPKQMIEVEVPEGWEVVRFAHHIDEGEHTLVSHDMEFRVHRSNHSRLFDYGAVVVRKRWEYPEWLGGGGVAMCADGGWRVFNERPAMAETDWSYRHCLLYLHTSSFPQWTPPSCDDWRESWHANPKPCTSHAIYTTEEIWESFKVACEEADK